MCYNFFASVGRDELALRRALENWNIIVNVLEAWEATQQNCFPVRDTERYLKCAIF